VDKRGEYYFTNTKMHFLHFLFCFYHAWGGQL
jgi:hypothetical protein